MTILMTILDARSRRARKAKREIRRRKAENSWADEVTEQLPDDPILFLDQYCWFEHVNTHEPVRGLRPFQIDYLENRTVCCWDEWGNPLPGKDIHGKSRRQAWTALGIAMGSYRIFRIPRGRARLYAHLGRDDILEPFHLMFQFLNEHYPSGWADGWVLRKNRWVNPLTRSSFAFSTAGKGEESSKKQGRGGGYDWVHLTEIGYMDHAKKLMTATSKAVPVATGNIYAESTFDENRDHAFAVEYRYAKEGKGRFDKAFFWPWFVDPLKRIPANSPTYARVMDPSYELSDHDRESESKLNLDAEQVCFRRAEFTLGDPQDRREARRENPEHDEQPFELGENYIDQHCLDLLEMDALPAPIRSRITPLFSQSIWIPDPAWLVLGVDNATRDGRDYKAVVGLDPSRKEQVCELHGRATDHEAAVGIAALIDQLGVEPWQYWIVPESNKAKDLIVELVKLGLNVWESEEGSTGKGYGVYTGKESRQAFIAALAGAVEGDTMDEQGRPLPRTGPTWRFRSSYLIAEIKSLHVAKDGLVRGRPHDDLAIAAAIGVYISWRIKLNRPALVDFSDIGPASPRDGGLTGGPG